MIGKNMRLLGCCCLLLVVVVAGVDVGNTPGWSWWWWIRELMASLSNTILEPSPSTAEVVNSDSFADAVVVTEVVLATVVVVDVVVVETVVVVDAVVVVVVVVVVEEGTKASSMSTSFSLLVTPNISRIVLRSGMLAASSVVVMASLSSHTTWLTSLACVLGTVSSTWRHSS